MKYLFICYPRCGTCQKAKKWLDDNNIVYEYRHIVEQNPTSEELKKWVLQSGLPIKKFFNTSGKIYREMKLKDKIPQMTDEELIGLLSTNGMLVKRPLLVGDNKVLVGFKADVWESINENS
ncbi:MAG: arsenate reductase family protein [Tepidanaerobacteraceae bacterium]|jgi:arsenate reductase|nr:arsenate reductase family protein [Thermoanaerobacterales bacterium]